MTTAFQKPNKTKSLFSQVDAQRPAFARQKLGGIEGAVGVVNNQAAGQQGENATVQAQQAQVASGTRQTYANLDRIHKVSDRVDQQSKFVNQSTPVFNTSIAATGSTPIVTGASGTRVVTGDASLAGRTESERAAKEGQNRTAQTGYETQGNLLTGMTTAGATQELSDAYGADTKSLRDAELQMTEGNLGVLANESDFEMEQAKLAQVLADRQSNVGKLKALYGVGYDTTKYGALDSNVLQGQFNDAAVGSTDALKSKDLAQKEGSRVRESYLDQIDTSKTQTEKAKGVADTEITRLGSELGRLDELIGTAIRESGGRMTSAIQSLLTSKKAVDKAYGDKVAAQKLATTKENTLHNDETAFKEKADADHKKKNELSAKLRNGYGIEVNPITATENEMKYWGDLWKRAETGDAGAIALLATGPAGRAHGLATRATLAAGNDIGKGIQQAGRAVNNLVMGKSSGKSVQQEASERGVTVEQYLKTVEDAKKLSTKSGKSGTTTSVTTGTGGGKSGSTTTSRAAPAGGKGR